MSRRGAALLLFLASFGTFGCARSTSGPSTRHWLPTWAEAPGDPRTAAAIGFAQAQVGKRYCWGGTGPDCFDCSGLVQSAWRWGGVALPRTSGAQGRVLVEVSRDQVRPGDILWWPHHVGLYVGGGEMIDAYHSGAGVVRRRAAIPVRVLRVVPGDPHRGP
ncbi:MAG TPA: NlpC/P60 family protein [Labilithrix sp.]|nr:NlpC/P60 family protein [Labilithrix sp.]